MLGGLLATALLAPARTPRSYVDPLIGTGGLMYGVGGDPPGGKPSTMIHLSPPNKSMRRWDAVSWDAAPDSSCCCFCGAAQRPFGLVKFSPDTTPSNPALWTDFEHYSGAVRPPALALLFSVSLLALLHTLPSNLCRHTWTITSTPSACSTWSAPALSTSA